MDASTALFTYGTLMPGQANAQVLAGLSGCWRAARVRGRLYPQGWGEAAGYPGLVLDSAAGWISGQLLKAPDLVRHWARLDAFEGPGYRRVTVRVTDEAGRLWPAQVYVLAEDPERAA